MEHMGTKVALSPRQLVGEETPVVITWAEMTAVPCVLKAIPNGLLMLRQCCAPASWVSRLKISQSCRLDRCSLWRRQSQSDNDNELGPTLFL